MMQEMVVEIAKPAWCHHHCIKMRVESLDQCKSALVIAGSTARLTIEHRGSSWSADWEVMHGLPGEKAGGRVWFYDHELGIAFGLREYYPVYGRYGGPESQELLDIYKPDAAFQGLFIRTGPFLSIPCPGTGHDGDPNISVYISEEIREAVVELLRSIPRP